MAVKKILWWRSPHRSKSNDRLHQYICLAEQTTAIIIIITSHYRHCIFAIGDRENQMNYSLHVAFTPSANKNVRNVRFSPKLKLEFTMRTCIYSIDSWEWGAYAFIQNRLNSMTPGSIGNDASSRFIAVCGIFFIAAAIVCVSGLFVCLSSSASCALRMPDHC